MRRILLVLTLSFAAHAGVTYTSSGVFGPTVPTSFFTAPDQPWAFSFSIDSNPVVSNVLATSFDPAFTGFTYLLNSIDLGLNPARIAFYDASLEGMFLIRFSTDNEFSFTGPQMFLGPTSSPTMLIGAFLSTPSLLSENYIEVGNVVVGDLVGTTVYATPEPSTIVLAAGGVLALLTVRRRRR